MKYICTEDKNGNKEIFTFPNTVNHDCMAEVLTGIKNQTWDNWERIHRQPVSAGFVNLSNECYGHSETLNLRSLPEDTEILRDQ